MFTKKRMNHALKKAKHLEIDNNTKIIFFSDIHRGDNSLADEFAKNQTIYYHAMQYYYDHGYTYIELGDGDELWEYKHFKVIRYAHSDVFMLLKQFHDEERLYMVFGNHNIRYATKRHVKHDLERFFDEYHENVNLLFHDIEVHESILLKHKDTKQEIFCVHGHQGDFWNDQLWILNMTLMRYFWRLTHAIGFNNPASPAKNAHNRHKVEKSIGKWIQETKQITIVGHTHRPKFPKDGELPYFNDGCCVRPRNITGLEIVNGEIMMVEWRVIPKDGGALHIDRKIIRGPRKLTDFAMK